MAEKIVIVEDNKSTRVLLAKMVKKMGYDPVQFSNGVEAWDFLSQLEQPDKHTFPVTIITDIVMPEMDGKGLIKKLSLHPFLNIIPVVGISAIADKDSIMDTMQLGALSYIQKPVQYEELKVIINNHVRIFNFYISEKNLSEFRGQLLEAVNIKGLGSIDALKLASKARQIMRNTLRIPGDPKIVYIGDSKNSSQEEPRLTTEKDNFIITHTSFKAIIKNTCDSEQLAGVIDLLRYLGNFIEKGLLEQKKLIAEKKTNEVLAISSESLKNIFSLLQEEIDNFITKKEVLGSDEVKHLTFLESQVLQKLQLLVFDLAKAAGLAVNDKKLEKLKTSQTYKSTRDMKDIQKDVDSIIADFVQ